MPRQCPLCSRRLERVIAKEQAIYCCADCSVAWREGVERPSASQAVTVPSKGLVCPDCRDQVLAPRGTTGQGQEWRCPGCHGRLLQVANAKGADAAGSPSADGEVAAFAVEVLAFFGEALL